MTASTHSGPGVTRTSDSAVSDPAVGSDVVRVPASPATALRGLGLACLVLACLVMVASMLGFFLDGTAAVVAVVIVLLLAIVPTAAVVTAIYRIQGRGAHLTYTRAGFENCTAMVGAGRKKAFWRDVDSLEIHGESLVISLEDGQQSIVHARVLGYSPESIAHAIRPLVGRRLV